MAALEEADYSPALVENLGVQIAHYKAKEDPKPDDCVVQ